MRVVDVVGARDRSVEPTRMRRARRVVARGGARFSNRRNHHKLKARASLLLGEAETVILGVTRHESHESVPISLRLHHVSRLDAARFTVDELRVDVHRAHLSLLVVQEHPRDVTLTVFKHIRFGEDEERRAVGAVLASREFHFGDRGFVLTLDELNRRRPRARHRARRASRARDAAVHRGRSVGDHRPRGERLRVHRAVRSRRMGQSCVTSTVVSTVVRRARAVVRRFRGPCARAEGRSRRLRFAGEIGGRASARVDVRRVGALSRGVSARGVAAK